MEKEKEMAQKLTQLDHIKIPSAFNYNSLQSLSTEARLKLSKIQPENLGQASRISGINPSDISVLLIHLNRH
jgi:tRNA uridine 5-carboxymethylaminomethyl modification enzyme